MLNQLRPVVGVSTTQDFDQITTNKPVKSLLRPRHGNGPVATPGGSSPSRHRGGGAKRRYRIISWKLPDGFEASGSGKSSTTPTAAPGLLGCRKWPRVRYHYILAPKGDPSREQQSRVGPEAPIKIGNRLPLAAIPLGTLIHALSNFEPGRGAQLVRAAGQSARLTAKDDRLCPDPVAVE